MRTTVLTVILLGPAGAVAVLDDVRRTAFPALVGLLDHRTGQAGEPDTTQFKQRISLLVEPLPSSFRCARSPRATDAQREPWPLVASEPGAAVEVARPNIGAWRIGGKPGLLRLRYPSVSAALLRAASARLLVAELKRKNRFALKKAKALPHTDCYTCSEAEHEDSWRQHLYDRDKYDP